VLWDFGGATRIAVPQLKTITQLLIPTTAMLMLALTSCRDENSAAEQKTNDRPNQGMDQRVGSAENQTGRLENADQRQGQTGGQQQSNTGSSAGGSSAGANTTGGSSTGGSTGGTGGGSTGGTGGGSTGGTGGGSTGGTGGGSTGGTGGGSTGGTGGGSTGGSTTGHTTSDQSTSR
jgi:hypothetical protein